MSISETAAKLHLPRLEAEEREKEQELQKWQAEMRLREAFVEEAPTGKPWS